MRLFKAIVKTPIGPVSVIWSDESASPRVREILLPKTDSEKERPSAVILPEIPCWSSADIDALSNRLQASLEGENIRFSSDDLAILRLDGCTPFRQQVLRAVFAIPRGRVSSYGRIAASVNRPGAARAVGTAMATNPFPLIIPCHRVVQSDGHIGQFGGGQPMKKTLLALEDVPFQSPFRVGKAAFWG